MSAGPFVRAVVQSVKYGLPWHRFMPPEHWEPARLNGNSEVRDFFRARVELHMTRSWRHWVSYDDIAHGGPR
jgi:hypothetical protein